MTTLLIPVRFGVPAFRELVTLSGADFILDVTFNDRDSAWYLSVSDVDDAPIVEGVKIVLGLPLLRNCVDVRRPLGDFIAIDTSSAGAEAVTVDDLGDVDDDPRVVLVYEDGAAP